MKYYHIKYLDKHWMKDITEEDEAGVFDWNWSIKREEAAEFTEERANEIVKYLGDSDVHKELARDTLDLDWEKKETKRAIRL